MSSVGTEEVLWGYQVAEEKAEQGLVPTLEVQHATTGLIIWGVDKNVSLMVCCILQCLGEFLLLLNICRTHYNK